MFLSGAFVRRVRVQSVPDIEEYELSNQTDGEAQQNPICQRKSLAQACTELSYNAILNVEALKDAVRQKPSLIVVRFSRNKSLEYRVSLKILRRFLLLSHLIVLVATLFCFASWPVVLAVTHNYKESTLSPSNDESLRETVDLWMVQNFGALFANSVPYMDRVLSVISGFLLFYYLIFGFLISLFFGGPTDLLIVVLSSPIILLFAVGLNILAVVVILLRASLSSADQILAGCVSELSSEFRASLLSLHDLLHKNGYQFSAVIVLSSLVLCCLTILPWFVYDLPFQRMLDIEDMVIYDIEKRQVKSFPRSTEDVLSARQTKSKQKEAEEKCPERQPYRTMPSAQTVLLQLCPPEIRYLQR